MKFFNSLESMCANAPPYSDPFVVQWEIPQPKDQRERMYIVFDGLTEYIKYMRQSRYTTCHELLISQTYDKEMDITGHPAFDIDSVDPLPDGWMELLAQDIKDILSKQYPSSEDTILNLLSKDVEWVWLTSPSTKKLSKHLIIRGITFAMWRTQMKILMNELAKMDRCYTQALDHGIIRKSGSLRLPYNSKRHTYHVNDQGISTILERSPTLIFDNPIHGFTDGLIMIHDENLYTFRDSILLTQADLSPEYRDQFAYIVPQTGSIRKQEYLDIDTSSLEGIFERLDSIHDTGLKPGNISGSYLPLLRYRPGKCPISGRTHESENAYLYMRGNKVCYSCHRGCKIHLDGYERKYIDVTFYKDGNDQTVKLCLYDLDKMNK